jgi:transposase InsO family protein
LCIAHFNVMTNLTSAWVIQQLRESFPEDSAPHYLVHDRDSIFGVRVDAAITALGTEPIQTAYRCPWQNAYAERWIGTCRRELLDHVIVLDEKHLKRLLSTYVGYYNEDRVHTRTRDAPLRRPVERWPSSTARVVGRPRSGGLQHRYTWAEAA